MSFSPFFFRKWKPRSLVITIIMFIFGPCISSLDMLDIIILCPTFIYYKKEIFMTHRYKSTYVIHVQLWLFYNDNFCVFFLCLPPLVCMLRILRVGKLVFIVCGPGFYRLMFKVCSCEGQHMLLMENYTKVTERVVLCELFGDLQWD